MSRRHRLVTAALRSKEPDVNTTFSPPTRIEEQRGVRPDAQGYGKPVRQPQRPLPKALAALFLVLSLAHLAVIPGTAIDSQRYGWDGSIWSDPPLFITWPIGLLLLSAALLCYVLAALRPLGLPVGPRNWAR